ncbi:protein fuzzy homolog [Oppia nitens]|uniref:protein fuzzy homolog n=1 Tax=Oppia nitens TaxID=1686743 RepID=UPI0023DB426F|nr:protein fuzzy homolog [Oppia nitens]
MSVTIDLIAVTAIGGLPLFMRHCSQSVTNSSLNGNTTSGDNDLSFARMAALNGVNLFSRLNDSNLMYCSTKESQIRWKVFKGCLVLIVIVEHMTDVIETHLHQLLDLVFDSLVMICGLNEIMSQNIERLKRCLRHSYQLIDHILNEFISSPLSRLPFITNNIEYSMSCQSYQHFMQSLVESGGQLSCSAFCWLQINRKLVAASHAFWSRLNTSKDALLAITLVNSLSDTDLLQTKEIPVYLPDNCPTSLSRLIVCQLAKNVVLCLLCAEEPSIDFIDTEIAIPLIDSKIHSEKFSIYLRNEIQILYPIDPNVIAFIIFRKDLKLYFTFGPIDDNFNVLLQSINWQTSDKYESYLVNETTKGYIICNDLMQIYLSFRFNASLNQMQSISNKTLNIISKDKYICSN